ncbi:TPA: tyrosine-type recombinase/integrase [Enterobacter hormaechei subsp. xiangfangensis]|nr:tyrosine-type recombinase/integrase [Enterobacter hormaechei subsp. xiangfangensis]
MMAEINVEQLIQSGEPCVRALGGGLSIKVTAAGGVSFMFRYQLDGSAVSTVLGKWPRMTQEHAEAIAERCRNWLADGLDPRIMLRLEPATARAGALTVREMVENWIPRTRRKDKITPLAVMEKHIFPTLGDLPVDSLTSAHWIAQLDAVAATMPTTARELLTNLKSAQRAAYLMQQCTSRALFDVPARFIAEKPPASTRTLNEDELRDVLKWTTNGRAPEYYRNLVRLLLTFGARTVELRCSRPGEWDMKRRIWVVPAAHSKTGKEIIRPIPEAVIPTITRLLELAHRTKSPLLLRSDKAQSTVSDYCAAIWKKLGHESEWSAHDLRRTARTCWGDLGVQPWVGELLLGHAVGGIAGVYDRSTQLTEKRRALDVWCAELNKIERAGLLAVVNQ